jgi:hypothetical protein
MADGKIDNGPPERQSWLWVVKYILVGSPARTIAERFFGIGSFLVCITTASNATNREFPDVLIFGVSAEIVVALVAVLLKKLEGGEGAAGVVPRR